MVSRLGFLASFVVVLAGLALSSCAEGAAAVPGEQIAGELPDAGTTCGNNVVDTQNGEACDCLPTATTMCAVSGTDCMAAGMGTGLLYCNPNTCQFITEMCSANRSGGGSGTSASGAGRGG